MHKGVRGHDKEEKKGIKKKVASELVAEFELPPRPRRINTFLWSAAPETDILEEETETERQSHMVVHKTLQFGCIKRGFQAAESRSALSQKR